jgi:hypothetical protein
MQSVLWVLLASEEKHKTHSTDDNEIMNPKPNKKVKMIKYVSCQNPTDGGVAQVVRATVS